MEASSQHNLVSCRYPASSEGTDMSKSPFLELPIEILRKICMLLAEHDRQTSILNLVQTCRALSNVAKIFLYYDIDTSDWFGRRMHLLMDNLWSSVPRRSFVRRLHFRPTPHRASIANELFYMENFLNMTQNLQVFHLNLANCRSFPREQRQIKMEALQHIILENLHDDDHHRVLDFIEAAPKLEVLTMRFCWYGVECGLLRNLKCLELIDVDELWEGSELLDGFLPQCPQLESLTLTTARYNSDYNPHPTEVEDISIMLSPCRDTLRHLRILWRCWFCKASGSLRDFTRLETVVIGFLDQRTWLPETHLVDLLPPTVQSVTLDISTLFVTDAFNNEEIEITPNVFASMEKLGEAKQQGLFPSLQSFTHSHHHEAVEFEELSRTYGMQFQAERKSAFDDVLT